MVTYSEQLGAFEPMKAHNFRMFIRSTGVGSNLVGDDFSLAIVTGFTPSESSEEIEIGIDNERVYYAGRQSYDSGSVTVRDYVDLEVAAYIKEWRKRVFNPETGQMGYKAEYAGTAIVQQYDPKGDLVREWKLINVWPVSVNYGTVDQASTDHITLDITLRYDKAIMTVG